MAFVIYGRAQTHLKNFEKFFFLNYEIFWFTEKR